jgi:hypothetical protein
MTSSAGWRIGTQYLRNTILSDRPHMPMCRRAQQTCTVGAALCNKNLPALQQQIACTGASQLHSGQMSGHLSYWSFGLGARPGDSPSRPSLPRQPTQVRSTKCCDPRVIMRTLRNETWKCLDCSALETPSMNEAVGRPHSHRVMHMLKRSVDGHDKMLSNPSNV